MDCKIDVDLFLCQVPAAGFEGLSPKRRGRRHVPLLKEFLCNSTTTLNTPLKLAILLMADVGKFRQLSCHQS